MANRNFDSRVIIQRLQNRVYSRNLYNNNTTGHALITNPQTTDGNSSRYVTYVPGAQTDYFRSLSGTTTISQGGIANIPPYPSIPSNNSTTVPSAPINLIATPDNTQVSIAFTQGSTGGSVITNYEYSIDNGVTFIACSPTIITSPVLITGLTNGTTYQIKLKAVNAVGTSAASDAVSATPATIPDAPVITFITAGDTQLSVSFTQGSDGGNPIINYYYSTDDGISFIACSPIVTTSPILITGLTNGTTYTIKLRAINFIGLGNISNGVSATPVAAPMVLTYSTVGSTTWTAPLGVTSIDYLVVAGGGGSGGGYDTGGGGGGGGGMVLSGTTSVTPGTIYTIIVGDGGAGGVSNRLALPETNGSPGDNSSFDTIVSLGGSGGYASRFGPPNSLGGAAAVNPSTASEGGHGGGSAGDANGAGGGGGGSSGNGNNGVSNVGGTGGAGTVNSITGFALTYATGGRGANGNSNNAAVAGTSNTGNGARGGGAVSFADNDGAKGGSGVVVISYSP